MYQLLSKYRELLKHIFTENIIFKLYTYIFLMPLFQRNKFRCAAIVIQRYLRDIFFRKLKNEKTEVKRRASSVMIQKYLRGYKYLFYYFTISYFIQSKKCCKVLIGNKTYGIVYGFLLKVKAKNLNFSINLNCLPLQKVQSIFSQIFLFLLEI